MKQLFFGACFFLATGTISAQEWKTDLDAAFKEASVSHKNILLFFSVSDACDICRSLDNVIFKSEEFEAYAKENLILVKLDFKNANSGKTNKSEELLIVEKYNKDGFFPWVVLVNSREKLVSKIGGYDGQSPTQYINTLRKADNKG